MTSKTFNQRPSDFLDIREDPYAAYCLDQAVSMFGRSLENELSSISKQSKREQVLRKWLDMKVQYRDPARSGHASRS